MKKTAQQQVIDYKNSIFEEKTAQINLRRRKEECKYDLLTLKEDLDHIED